MAMSSSCSLSAPAIAIISASIVLLVHSFQLIPTAGASAIIGEERDGGREGLASVLRDEAVLRILELGKVSDSESFLERTFLSPASRRARDLIISWMQDAGLNTWVDQIGNVHGRFDPPDSSFESLLIGSHLDTVIDAGMYDGSLGIICALAAIKSMKITGVLQNLTRPIEVIAFSEEEGVRFQSTLLGSSAVAGTLPASILQVSDRSGATVQDALKESGFEASPEILDLVKYNKKSIAGYVEVHIEQGPVLENLGYPLGVVKGIAGQTRLKVVVQGSQGHAGTVPMELRRDPMVAAAELITSLESLCKEPEKFLLPYNDESSCFSKNAPNAATMTGLVCTVGELSVWPGASNVIPAQVNFTVDIRTVNDAMRQVITSGFTEMVNMKCDLRSVNCTIQVKLSIDATPCDPQLTSDLKDAVHSALQELTPSAPIVEVPLLTSGAGHDGMAMAALTKIGMLFVRCRGGISHSPAEHVLDGDVWAASLSLVHFLHRYVGP